jgi:hypothetical protein
MHALKLANSREQAGGQDSIIIVQLGESESDEKNSFLLTIAVDALEFLKKFLRGSS